MATKISVSDVYGQGGGAAKANAFAPVPRTPQSAPEEVGALLGSDKVGTLPDDPAILEGMVGIAKEFNVPPEDLLAFANQESNYNPKAYNAEFGASGMFQYIPSTAKSAGIDPFDWLASARQTAADYAGQVGKGRDWAIKHHFAGPNEKGHGPKTQQYLADVSKRASDIKKLLDIKYGTDPQDPAPIPGSKKAQAASGKIPLSAVYGPKAAPKVQADKKLSDPLQQFGVGDNLARQIADSAGYVAEAAEKSWDHIQRRWETDTGQITPDDPRYTPVRRANDPFQFQRLQNQQISRDVATRDAAVRDAGNKGFLANTKNIGELLTTESLPANFAQQLARAPENEQKKFWDARKVLQQEEIVAHPEKYPAVSVEAAQQAIAAREKKTPEGVREMWTQLKAAWKEDPGKVGAQFFNALAADPEMLLAPQGIVPRALTTAEKTASIVQKIGVTATKVIDAGATGAALNMGIEAAAAGKEGREANLGVAALTGGIPAAALSPLFGRGLAAVDNINAGKVTQDTLQEALDAAAQMDNAADDIIRQPTVAKNVKHQIEEATGATFESDADLKAYLKIRQAEWKKLFKDRDLHGQYQQALADERLNRVEFLKAEGQKAAQVDEAWVARQAEVAQERTEGAEGRHARYQQQYDEALANVESTQNQQTAEAFDKQEQLKVVTSKLDEQEILDAAFDGAPQVRDAMLRATARDSKLAHPKWQRGEVDPRLLARVGVGGLFAGTAFAVAPPEDKMAAASAAFLAGMIVPGGGRVLNKLRQSGVMTVDGDIVSLLAKQGKLVIGKTAEEAKARDIELSVLARKGDQRAMKEIYTDNFPHVRRYVNKFIRDNGARLGLDAEDLTQEAFVAAFQNIERFDGTSQLRTWINAIARNTTFKAIREAQADFRGGEYEFTSTELPNMRDQYGESYSQDVFDKGIDRPDSLHQESPTPEQVAERDDANRILIKAIEALPESQRVPFIMNRVEQITAQEISDSLKMPLGTVLVYINRAQESVDRAIAKSYNAVKAPAAGAAEELVKRGRGRPRKQAGEIDQRLLKTLGIATAGGIVGTMASAMTEDEEGDLTAKEQMARRIIGGLAGAGTGVLLLGGGRAGLKSIGKFADDIGGASSTRILNYSKKIHKAVLSTERKILDRTHQGLTAVDPFLKAMNSMPGEGKGVLTRALMTGNAKVIDRILQAYNDPKLSSEYHNVRRVLDSIGDKLVDLKRFARKNIEYFPRVVKDKEGLFKAIGKESASTIKQRLEAANVESLRKHGRPLNPMEESAIITQSLFLEQRGSQLDFTKNRGVEEITPALQQFYASPEEALHSYIRDAVQDIEAADFFGGHAKNIRKGEFEHLDVDGSVKSMMADELKAGTMTDEQAREISDILRARFKEGLRGEADIIKTLKNIGNAGLLGNFFSSITQLADVGVSFYTQGITPTLEALARQVTGRKLITAKELGLVDHISEEFSGQLASTRALHKIFKFSLFTGADQFGKNTAINAAIAKGRNLVKDESGRGMQQLSSKYAEAFGKDFNQLASDLKASKVTDLTKDYAFMELSRTQPISRIEMPLAYLKHPNARSYLWLKSFMMKQLDLVRRDAIGEMKAGNVAKGMKNLAEIAIVLGASGMATDKVKKWILGEDVDFKWTDIPENILKTYGFSSFVRDQMFGVSKEEAERRREEGNERARAQTASPIGAVASTFIPPYKVFDQVLRADPAATRYVPFVGPVVARWLKETSEGEVDE